MKHIKGHRSWNKQEVIRFLLRSGTFTMCTLPHYRYDRVKRVCHELRRKGWIEKSGRTDQGVNWKITDAFRTHHGMDLI